MTHTVAVAPTVAQSLMESYYPLVESVESVEVMGTNCRPRFVQSLLDSGAFFKPLFLFIETFFFY